MNNELKLKTSKDHPYMVGDLFTDDESAEVYVITKYHDTGMFAAINIISGTRWREVSITPEGAVRGLIRLQPGDEINIKITE